jgi:hypothetical protein
MTKRILIVFTLLMCSTVLFSQELKKAPKSLSLEVGYRYLASNTFDLKTQGSTLLFDYAWQLSGFTGRPAAFISVPLGYTSFFGGDGEKTGGILSYGWTVRHNLSANKKTIPFFGYGLLLNQLRLSGTDGSIFGHQTRFDYGYTFNSDKKIKPFVKIEYSYTRYPRFGQKESDKIHAFELKGGVRF